MKYSLTVSKRKHTARGVYKKGAVEELNGKTKKYYTLERRVF